MKLLSLLDHTLKLFSACTLAAMTLIVLFNVVLRYFFHSGIPWSEELARICFVYVIFTGIVIAARSRSHLMVDFITSKLPAVAKKICSVIADLLSIIILFIVLNGAWHLILLTRDLKMPATELSSAWLYLPALLASTLCIGIFIVSIYKTLYNTQTV